MDVFSHFTRHAAMLAGTLLLCGQALDKLNGNLASRRERCAGEIPERTVLAVQGKTAGEIEVF